MSFKPSSKSGVKALMRIPTPTQLVKSLETGTSQIAIVAFAWHFNISWLGSAGLLIPHSLLQRCLRLTVPCRRFSMDDMLRPRAANTQLFG